MSSALNAGNGVPTFNTADGLFFMALGGSGEIGENFYLYCVDDHWLIVDCGVRFGDESTPGIDVILADPSFIEARRDKLLGIVLTHGHEDHFGAIEHLWQRLRVPVYGTPFTTELLQLKLDDRRRPEGEPIELVTIAAGDRLPLGPFEVEFISVTHSIPDATAVALHTPHGTVLHSGDWKLDPEPMVGARTDIARFRQLGEEGVLAYVGDSTNALEPGRTGSEGEVAVSMVDLFKTLKGRVAVTCFSTNVARMQSVARAAHANGRHWSLVGRSLLRSYKAAVATGLIDVPEDPVPEREVGYLPNDKMVLLCTGSQGESRSALSKIAFKEHRHISFAEGDTVIYSAREIPGNERSILRVQNRLISEGIRVIDVATHHIHVSGHPSRDDMIDMYQWIRPKIALPVHGEPRHQLAHREIAKACQVPSGLVPQNGELIRLDDDGPTIVGRIEVASLGLDGGRLIDMQDGTVPSRRRIVHSGAAVITLILDDEGELAADPAISLLGVVAPDDVGELTAEAILQIGDLLDTLSSDERLIDSEVEEAARIAVRRTVRNATGKKPVTEVHIVRLPGNGTDEI